MPRPRHGHLPSTPILPSPSLSPAAISVLVSLADRSLASGEKPFRMNLQEEREKVSRDHSQGHRVVVGWHLRGGRGQLGQAARVAHM